LMVMYGEGSGLNVLELRVKIVIGPGLAFHKYLRAAGHT
jgi:hypothetical protein